MSNEQLKKLSKMKRLIRSGHRRFAKRKDRDILQDLFEIGINEEYAWNIILSLTAYDFVNDYRPFYNKKGDDALIFKRIINKKLVYIKIKIEEYNMKESTVCLSFHIDHKRGDIL